MKQMHREDMVESSLFLSDLSGRIFEWPQALRHHEDATMRLLHGQQRAAADECTPHGDQAAQTDGMSCGATDERSRPTLRSWVQPRENAQPSKRISRDIDYIPRNLRRTSSAAAFSTVACGEQTAFKQRRADAVALPPLLDTERRLGLDGQECADRRRRAARRPRRTRGGSHRCRSQFRHSLGPHRRRSWH